MRQSYVKYAKEALVAEAVICLGFKSKLNLSKQHKTWQLMLRDCRVLALVDDVARLVW